MAAIYGIVGDADLSELSAMGARLAHRGTAVREWEAGPNCLLGQRADTASGDQSGLSIAFDGHLENVPELAAQLGIDDPFPAPEHLLATLFERFGPEGASYLEGQFAIAMWDDSNKRLLLIRDRSGSRPLVATRSRGRYLFASEYKALLAIPDVAAQPNLDTVRQIQCTKIPPVDATMLAGVTPVKRSAWTAVTPTTDETKRYWSPKVAIAQRSHDEHVSTLRHAFLEAVRRQVTGFDPIGVQLSGGFDSALALGGVHKVASGVTVHTFTAGYGMDDPEMIDATRLAQHFGTVHHPLVLDPDEIPDLLPPTVWHMEDFYGREEQVYLYMLVREASKHVKLLITGYEADMTVGGMPRHMLAWLTMRFPLARAPLAEFYHYTQTGLFPRSLMGKALVRLYYRGQKDFPPPHVIGTDYEPAAESLKPVGSQPLSEHLARGIEDILGLEQEEQLYRAWGISYNSPYLHPKYVECTLSIPDRLKIRGRTQKYVLRRVAEGLLPPDAVRRRKTLQRLKHDEQFSSVVDRMAERLLDQETVRNRGLFDLKVVDQLRQRPSHGKPYSTAQLYRLWTLIETELWFRTFIDRRGERPE